MTSNDPTISVTPAFQYNYGITLNALYTCPNCSAVVRSEKILLHGSISTADMPCSHSESLWECPNCNQTALSSCWQIVSDESKRNMAETLYARFKDEFKKHIKFCTSHVSSDICCQESKEYPGSQEFVCATCQGVLFTGRLGYMGFRVKSLAAGELVTVDPRVYETVYQYGAISVLQAKEVEKSKAASKECPTTLTESQQLIAETCNEVRELLLEKNRKYGDSALNPKRVFSRADAVEQIKVRLDDKISRLMNQQHDEDEDVIQDLIGYLILLRVAQKRAKSNAK